MPLREVEPRSVASSREGFLVFVHNVEDLLQPSHMRSLLTCSSATSWTKMQGCITNLVKRFMESQKLSKLELTRMKTHHVQGVGSLLTLFGCIFDHVVCGAKTNTK